MTAPSLLDVIEHAKWLASRSWGTLLKRRQDVVRHDPPRCNGLSSCLLLQHGVSRFNCTERICEFQGIFIDKLFRNLNEKDDARISQRLAAERVDLHVALPDGYGTPPDFGAVQQVYADKRGQLYRLDLETGELIRVFSPEWLPERAA